MLLNAEAWIAGSAVKHPVRVDDNDAPVAAATHPRNDRPHTDSAYAWFVTSNLKK
jgi:hypothetical protein